MGNQGYQLFDGDINMTTDNPILIKGIYDHLPAIFCEGKTSSKVANPQFSDFAKAIKDGFGNRVGSITNFGSSCYDTLSLFDENSKEYKEVDYRIKCIQYLQQEAIDSAKNGLPPRPIPSFWLNPNCEELNIWEDKEEGVLKNLTDEEFEFIEFNKRILTDRKPYYFRYIYQESDRQYREFVDVMEASALRGFGKTIKQIRDSEIKTSQEIEFLERFDEKVPLSNNPCIINVIAKIVEDEFDGEFSTRRYKKNFDYSVYKYNTEKKPTPSQIKEVCRLYEDYKTIIKSKKNNLASTKEEGMNKTNEMFDELQRELREIIIDEEVLVNTLIDLSYGKNKVTKAFAWCLGGTEILRCMLSKNNNEIHFPIRDENGDIEFDGEKFKMTKVVIKEEDI